MNDTLPKTEPEHIIVDIRGARRRRTGVNNMTPEIRAKSKLSPMNGKRGRDIVTLTKEQAMLNIQERIIMRSKKLLDAQAMLGLGTIRVYRIDAHYEYFGKQKKLVKEKPKLIDNDDEITAVLDHEYGTGEVVDIIEGEFPKFYFVEVQEPNNTAIDSQLNRVFGKAKESIDVTSNGNSIAPVIVGMRIIDESIRTSEVVHEIEAECISDIVHAEKIIEDIENQKPEADLLKNNFDDGRG